MFQTTNIVENDHRRRRNVIHWSSMKLNGCRFFWGEPLCFDGVWHPSCTVTYMFISWKYHQRLTRRHPSTICRPTCHRMFVALLASSSQQQVMVQWLKFRYLLYMLGNVWKKFLLNKGLDLVTGTPSFRAAYVLTVVNFPPNLESQNLSSCEKPWTW